MKQLICWLRGHRWTEYGYPSRWGDKAWRYERMPYLIEDPLIWNLAYEECDRCQAFRWRFATREAGWRYWNALHLTEERSENLMSVRKSACVLSPTWEVPVR